MEETSLVTREPQQVVVAGEMSVEQVLGQVSKIQEIMRRAMVEGEHYGVIPGTNNKPSLLQPGAQKLGLTFRLAPEYTTEVIDLPHLHREYRVTCRLTSITTGAYMGMGVGSCSTMEKKYRYRPGPVEFTGTPVPPAYWQLRKSDPQRAVALLGGPGHSVKKNPDSGVWEVVVQGETVENPDIADCYNTCWKMAKKRAYVDSTITVLAAADLFTQDLEDLHEPAAKPEPVPVPPAQETYHNPANPKCPECGTVCRWVKAGKKTDGTPYDDFWKCSKKGCKGWLMAEPAVPVTVSADDIPF